MRTIKGETFHTGWGPHPNLLSPSKPGARLAGNGQLDVFSINKTYIHYCI